jgi:sugar phosphate isomerase/epimerase
LAYDYWTARQMLQVIDRPELGINWDPSHMVWQDIDPAGFLVDFAPRIYHVHAKDSKKNLTGRNGRLSSHLPWADPRRGWDFVSVGHGDVPWEACFRALNHIGYTGPVSVEWEDAGMDRLRGAPEALAFVRSHQWDPPQAAFDAAFASS